MHQFTPAVLGKVNDWTLGGSWDISSEGITATGEDSVLRFRVAAKEVYVVTGNEADATIAVTLNGTPISQTQFAGSDVESSGIKISQPTLYRAVQFDRFQKDNTLELRVPAGVQLNVFTFGS
jgi:hypothetical protein